MELAEISIREPRCWHLAEEEKTSSFLLGEYPSKPKQMAFFSEWKEGAPAALDSWPKGGCVPGVVRAVCWGHSRWTSASLWWRAVWMICEGDTCVRVMMTCVFRPCDTNSLLAEGISHPRDSWG